MSDKEFLEITRKYLTMIRKSNNLIDRLRSMGIEKREKATWGGACTKA